MSSKLLINVNDASSAVVPDTDVPGAITPDTGMFSVSHADGVSFNTSMVLPIVGISILVIAIIVGTIVAIFRRKKVNRFTTHTNKHLVAKLTILSVVVLLGALGVMNADKLTSMVNAADNSEEDTLTITASDIEIDVDLNDTAVFAAGESKVKVDSATPYGYTLMAYVDSATTDLVNETNTSSSSTINMIDSLEPTALTSNTWGFATTKPTDQTSTVFTGIPNSLDEAITLKYTEEPTAANDESTFYYGTYITPEMDYGTYSGVTITYIAIANIVDICNSNATTIQEAICLQDFTGPNRDSIINSMVPETQYTLIDKRDEKPYTVAKLYASDGKRQEEDIYQIWMTKNLDLDLDSNTTYTNEDTDLGYNPSTGRYETASWTPSLSTYTSSNTTWNGSYTNPESYDIGDIYWNGTTFDSDNAWNEYYDTCSWDSNDTPYNCDESLNPINRATSSTGIPQYHLGNYYSWTAAIAMNDSSSYHNGELIEQSICPAGWTLPRIGDGLDSFFSLLFKYGFDNQSWWYDDYDVLHAVWMEPLYFTASGWWDGKLYTIGNNVNFWSPIAAVDGVCVGQGSCAGDAGFNVYGYGGSGYTTTTHISYRDNGQAVRCVARPVADDWFVENNPFY